MLRNMLLGMVVLLIVVSPVHAKMGEVVKTLRAPSPCPVGLAFDGKYLWSTDRKTDTIYKIDPESGRVLREFSAPGFNPGSICFDGKGLRVTDLFEKKIYRMDRDTGVFSDDIEMTSPDITGIASDGKNLWVCDRSARTISLIDSSDGTTITSFPAPSKTPLDITFDGRYLWCSDRVNDKIYAIDPKLKDVLFSLEAPGKYAWGLAWDGKYLWNMDYQERNIFKINVRHREKYVLYDKRNSRITYTSTVRNYGPGKVMSMDFFLAVPQDAMTQKLLSPISFTPEPQEMLSDQYDQKIAHYTFKDIPPCGEKKISFTVDASLWAIRYYIYPDEVGTSNDIPQEIKSEYLRDGFKYDINNPYIQKLVTDIVQGEDNLYRRARKLFDYLISHMEYKLEGGWNTAPTVLKRGTGSCSEYTFSYIALCRAAGIPARYLGTLVLRGDEVSFDDVFHRWSEIYLPPYGWVPVDANAGDEEIPADQAEAFGGYRNRFLITTRGGGGSSYLKWSYNCVRNLSFEGKCKIFIEDLAEWESLSKGDEKVKR